MCSEKKKRLNEQYDRKKQPKTAVSNRTQGTV
jgi:hypothetical protein